jgi:hypothetical protein
MVAPLKKGPLAKGLLQQVMHNAVFLSIMGHFDDT